ncbi:hypothetical protein, partial [uncultured Dialister sp.]|uniref:hypothetical protein n=2 Tax=uncultured Dialister sp. TaxID=278064 RepID=UPI00262E8917
SDCQRDQFGNKQECCYCQYTQCDNGWIHKVHLPFEFFLISATPDAGRAAAEIFLRKILDSYKVIKE